MKRIFLLFVVISLLPIVKTFSQCAQTSNIYTFTYGGHTYEVVKELKSWMNAAICAVDRDGYLVHIDTEEEKNYIMSQLMLTSAANISASYHPLTDGGGASYIWTGGTDQLSEGTWIWDGDNNDVGVNFYTGQGTAGEGNGVVIDGAYVNWGNVNGSEPDNFYWAGSEQNALGLSLGSWPHGVAGQWNDIAIGNTLYYIIEKDQISGINEINKPDLIDLYPNPSSSTITFTTNSNEILQLTIFNALGAIVVSEIEVVNEEIINVQNLEVGIYFYIFRNNQGIYQSGKFIKQ
jgi:hypothetical protein